MTTETETESNYFKSIILYTMQQTMSAAAHNRQERI